jgi:hypothetical protein
MKKKTDLLNHIFSGLSFDADTLTVGAWVQQWYDNYKKRDLRPSTADNYAYLIRVHIRARYDETALSKLHPAEIQRFYNDLAEKAIKGKLSRTRIVQ